MTSRLLIGWLVVLLLAPTPVAAQGWMADSWITSKVKIALLTSADVDGSDIWVDTVDGRVALFGKVPSEEQRKKAEEAAKATTGVTAVRNLLEVVPPSRAAAVQKNDDSLRKDAEKKLAKDDELAGTGIRVASVSAGTVVLGGTARNSAEHLHAIDVVRRVRGVRRVKSVVGTALEDATLDLWSRYELRQDDRGLLDVASDLWLTAETRLRLLADPRLPALDISVDCHDKDITLFGIVPSKEAKDAAKEVAEGVEGVDDVDNKLQVVSAAKQPTVQKRDEEIQKAVSEAIYARPEMKHAGIHAAVKNGVVRLTGTAPSQQHRLHAATAARAVAGVRAVEQDIRVSTVTMTQPAPGPTASPTRR